MLTPPTDNLYKFLAIFGIIIALSSSAFWWNSAKEFDEFFESNSEYLSTMIDGYEIHIRYIQKAKESLSIHNSVNGDYKLLSKEQNEALEKLLKEIEILESEITELEKANKSKNLIINSRLEKNTQAKSIGLFGIIFGLITSALGFYLWYSRTQKYIDKLHGAENS